MFNMDTKNYYKNNNLLITFNAKGSVNKFRFLQKKLSMNIWISDLFLSYIYSAQVGHAFCLFGYINIQVCLHLKNEIISKIFILFIDDAWAETHTILEGPRVALKLSAKIKTISLYFRVCFVCLRHSDKSQKPIILPWRLANFFKIFFPLFENVYYFLLYKTQLVYLRTSTSTDIQKRINVLYIWARICTNT